MNDSVFGELTFSIGWNKIQYIDVFDKDINIRVDCYENEVPNKKQQDTYVNFLNNQKDIFNKLQKELYDYIIQNEQDITTYTEIIKFISIKEILFLDDGRFLINFETKWNTHNSAALFSNNEIIIVATEDIVSNYL